VQVQRDGHRDRGKSNIADTDVAGAYGTDKAECHGAEDC
jgi:hypothetical protein